MNDNFTEDELKGIKAFQEQEKARIDKFVESIKDPELKEQVRQDRLDYLNSTQYHKLDKKNLICTSITDHQWEYDDPHHKICRKCGYGFYV